MDIEIIKFEVFRWMVTKKLNNHIECLSVTVNKKPLGLYLDIPKISILNIDSKKTIIVRTKKQLLKSIYLYFGLKIHKYY